VVRLAQLLVQTAVQKIVGGTVKYVDDSDLCRMSSCTTRMFARPAAARL